MPADNSVFQRTVTEFLEGMYAWETAAARALELLEAREYSDDEFLALIAKSDRAANSVLSRYCSGREPSAHKRPIGSPPEYDPSLEVIVDVKHRGSKAYVYTERSEEAVFPGKVMYVLVREKGQWKIDQKKLWNGKRYEHAEI